MKTINSASHKIVLFLATCMILLALCASASIPPASSDNGELSAPAAAVSGTIRHEGSPVAGVEVSVIWSGGSQNVTTGIDGIYLVSGVPTGGWIQIFVRPPVSMRLTFRNFGVNPSIGDLVKDFDLVDGYRLQGEFHNPDGTLFNQSFWLGITPLDSFPPPDEWLGAQTTNGRFDLVLPPGRCVLDPNTQTAPYFMPRVKVDLRTSDSIGLVVTLLNERPLALPTTPPDASRITVGSADSEGVATVTGQPSAVEAISDVVVVNLNTKNLAHTIADVDGGFTLNIFAPPGSTLLVKYDPDGWRTRQLLYNALNASSAITYSYFNPLPGTMINVGAPPPGENNYQYFTSAGGFIEDPSSTTHGKWAGWWLSGRVQVPAGPPPLKANPGQTVTLSDLVLHVTSPAFDCSGTPAISVNMNIGLRYLFALDGSPHPWGTWFTAHLFTPTGLPIEHEAGGETVGVGDIAFTSFTCSSTHAAVSAPLETNITIPVDLPEGTYQIQASLETGDVPQVEVATAPFVIVWYHSAAEVSLPILTVGDALPPHIPWTLLGDYPVDGRRGVEARQDTGIYAMPNRVITPPQRYVIPREESRNGELLVYRLEPGSHWLSASDRRFPNPPRIPLEPATGMLTVFIEKPDGSLVTLGPSGFKQTSQRTPTTHDGEEIAEGTGQIDDLYHLTTRDDTFSFSFDQYGQHVISLEGVVADIYGRLYSIDATYDVYVAHLLDLDPAQLPTTPYVQGDAFAPGLHLFPPVPAEVSIKVTHLPFSDPAQTITTLIHGQANTNGYFQPPVGTEIRFDAPGEFRVDINAIYTDTEGALWMGSQTWGSVVEGTNALIEAHGRRGMDYHNDTIDNMPAWFEVFNLPPEKVGIEVYYPYFSGDIHWGNEDNAPGDSIHSIITIRDLTSGGDIYNLISANYPRSRNGFRWPPDDTSPAGLQKRLEVGEAPLFLSTSTGHDPAVFPEEIDQWGYWYGSSERPDVHVREIISEDNMGTAYWRFNDTYNLQIGEGSMGDLPGDLKWEFGGAVFRVPGQEITEYAVYSSLWVLLPHGDPAGARVTPPFQFAAGGINGGPIMTLLGEEIDMLFLPKCVRPGDILGLGDTIAFCGHVGPPLDSRVDVTIHSPSGAQYTRSWHANKIGWLYDPGFDFPANEPGRWVVDVSVKHDRPYLPTGITPTSNNAGTVLGTQGWYEFYIVEPDSPRLYISTPQPGFLTWPNAEVEPLYIQGYAPPGTEALYYTIHDKGIVMGQGKIVPDASGAFSLVYDAKALHENFPMLSLTAHEGRWEGLADEVTISLLAADSGPPRAARVTLIGEQVYVENDVSSAGSRIYIPMVRR
jgi:hypothetical protein